MSKKTISVESLFGQPLLTDEARTKSGVAIAKIKAGIDEKYKDKPLPEWGEYKPIVLPKKLIETMKGDK